MRSNVLLVWLQTSVDKYSIMSKHLNKGGIGNRPLHCKDILCYVSYSYYQGRSIQWCVQVVKLCYCEQASGYLTVEGETWNLQEWEPHARNACREPSSPHIARYFWHQLSRNRYVMLHYSDDIKPLFQWKWGKNNTSLLLNFYQHECTELNMS
jgi:hypothetical protein